MAPARDRVFAAGVVLIAEHAATPCDRDDELSESGPGHASSISAPTDLGFMASAHGSWKAFASHGAVGITIA